MASSVSEYPAMIQRLSVEQFHKMMETGILREGDPIELIDGVLVRKDRSDRGGDPLSHGPQHANVVENLQEIGRGLQKSGFYLRVQLPVTLSDWGEPEPDAAVVRGTRHDYQTRHPQVGDITAVIEVADSSLETDRSTKQRIYATAGIPVYWIVNLRTRVVEVYQEPNRETGEYAQRRDYAPGETISLASNDSPLLAIAVDDILPVAESSA